MRKENAEVNSVIEMEILIEKGKHGTDYWDASTPEKLAASAYCILHANYEYGWYFRTEPRLLDEYTATKKANESIDEFKERIENFNKQETLYTERNNNWYNRMEALVTGSNAYEMITRGKGDRQREVPLSWELLSMRSDHEYESVKLVKVIDPIEELS